MTDCSDITFDPDSVLPDGAVVVVKRSTDPVRINNTTATVHAIGLADGEYRLVTDLAKFHSNNETSRPVEIDGGASGGVELYGFSPSSAMGDATLSLQTVGGTTLCSTNFTVLWVDISMRCGQDEPFSTDNGMGAYPASISGSKLGKQRHYGFILPSRPFNSPSGYGNIVELIGTVHPSDFTNSVILVRDVVDESFATLFTNAALQVDTYVVNKIRGIEPNGNDPREVDFQDVDPRPSGRVFDVDTPGLHVPGPEAYAHGTLLLARYNFLQYATFGSRRCSDDFPWHSRTTIRRTLIDDIPDFEFYSRPDLASDNECGTGHTSIQP